MQVHGVLIMTLLEMLQFLVLIDIRKNNILVLGERPTYSIKGSFESPEKKFSMNFTKVNTKFCLSLHDNADNGYLFVNRKDLVPLSLEKHL